MEQRMEDQRRQREDGEEEHSMNEPFALIPSILQRTFDVWQKLIEHRPGIADQAESR